MPDLGSAIGGATSLIGSAMSSSASSDAAATQAASGAAAIAEQRRQYDLNRSDLAPWRDSGKAALSKLDMLLGITPTADTASAPASGTSGGSPSTGSTVGPSTITGFTSNQYGQLLAPAGGITVTGVGGGGNSQFLKPVFIKEGNVIPSGMTLPGGQQVPFADNSAFAGTLNNGSQSSTPAAPSTTPSAQDPQYGSLLKDFTKDDFLSGQDPGYQFRMDEGQKAIERSAAARGGALSGRAVKEATRYGQDMASQEYGAAFNRYNTNRQTKYNFLSGQAGTGQAAVNTGVAAGSNSANNISDLYTQIGNVNAAGQIGSANSWSTGLNKIGSFFGSNSNNSPDGIPTSGGYSNGINWGAYYG